MSQAGREIHKNPPHMPQVGSSHFPSLLTHWPLEGAGHTDGHTDVSHSSMGATTQLTHQVRSLNPKEGFELLLDQIRRPQTSPHL